MPATAHTPYLADALPATFGSTLRLARALNWTVGNPAPHVVTLTAPHAAARVMFVADPLTGVILRTWVGRHPLPFPYLPADAMGHITRPGAPVSLTKAYSPADPHQDR